MSISRFVIILFPELKKLVSTLHMASVYVLLPEAPDARKISSLYLTRMTNLLGTASKGHYSKFKAIELRDTAETSIGSVMPVKSLEFQHTIRLIRELNVEIAEIEAEIKHIMDELNPPIFSIPGISYCMGAMILMVRI